MITAAEIQMIRNADPGAVLPGIDTKTGNPYATSTLLDVTKITQNSSAPYFYTPSQKRRIRHAERRGAQRHQFRHCDGDSRRQQCHDQGLHVHRNDWVLCDRSKPANVQRRHSGKLHVHGHQIAD